MAFELIEPGVAGNFQTALPEGEISLGRTGVALFHATDLSLVDIRARCVLLADPATLRVALRAPRDGEESQSAAVHTLRKGKTKNIDTGRRRVVLGRAIKRLGLTTAAVAGRYELVTHDDLLIIVLAPDKTGAKQGRGGVSDASMPEGRARSAYRTRAAEPEKRT